mgnify:CR=1 FL=1
MRYHCDVCGADITLTVRIRCAGGCNDFDVCGTCFCAGAEVGQHKAWHDYRVIEQHAYPIVCADWGADEELLLIDGCQIYGLGNWADIADHIGNRTKEEVEEHFIAVYVEGRNGTPDGDRRAEAAVDAWRAEQAALGNEPGPGEERLPLVGPDTHFKSDMSAEAFQEQRRERIERLRKAQAAYVPLKPGTTKPLVSQPTMHSELGGFMPGRLEFEQEYEQDAEHLVKDMEFGRVYSFGGSEMPSEWEALGTQGVTQGHRRMEASGRGGPVQEKAAVHSDPSDEENENETFADAQDSTAPEAQKREQSATPSGAPADGASGAADGAGGATDGTGGSTDGAGGAADGAAAGGTDAGAPGGGSGGTGETDDRAPDWDEDPADLGLKLAVLDMYEERLDRRARKKHFLFERNLVDYRRNLAAERRRPKEERELLARVKHFATMQTAEDFETFYAGLCYEEALKRAVRQLQQYRRMGVTTLADAARYDRESAERTKRLLAAAEGSLSSLPPPMSAASGRGRARERGTPADDELGTPGAAERPEQMFSFASAPGIQLLTPAEQRLCAALHILPQPFLVVKAAFLTSCYVQDKALTLEHLQRLVRVSPIKLSRVYDFFRQHGYLLAAREARECERPRGTKRRSSSTPPARSSSKTRAIGAGDAGRESLGDGYPKEATPQ